MAIVVPKIKTQYITLFNDEESYNAAKDDFTEVNWSAVKNAEHPDAVITPYQPSTRETHGFEPVDGETVKPDSAKRMFYYTFDHIFKTFFLEIIWGYSGWEWKDYEYNGTILKGGNLYKVKEITEVPSIPDGYRLQHINNFLNSQDKVTHVCWFDTSNIISMQNAFASGKKNTPFTLDCYDFPNVEKVNGAFKDLELRIIDDHTLFLGKVIEAASSEDDSAFYGIRIDNPDHIPSFNMPLLTSANYILSHVNLFRSITILDLNEVFVGDTLKNISSFVGALYYLDGSSNSARDSITIKLDVTGTNLSSSTIFDFTDFLYRGERGGINDRCVVILDLKTNNPVILDNALSHYSHYYCSSLTINNPNLIKSMRTCFQGRLWDDNFIFPYSQPINETVDDTEEFKGSEFRCDVDYDFSPNHTLKLSYGHFDNTYFISGTHVFRNMEYLNQVVFRPYEGFNTLPNMVWSPDIQYEFPEKYTKNEYMGDSRFKVIQLGGSITSIAPQTIYCLNYQPFTGNIALDENILLHCCQRPMENYTTSINISNNVMIKSPSIYIHFFNSEGGNSSRAGISISGSSLKEIDIHIVDETGDSGLRWLSISIGYQHSSLEKIVVDSNFYDWSTSWDVSKSPNIIISYFETLLMQRQLGEAPTGVSKGSLKLLVSQWNSLSTSCKDHCFEIFSYIDQVAE